MANLMTGAKIVFKALEDQGVEHIFGYPGGAVLPIYDELKNLYLNLQKKQNHILIIVFSKKYLLIFLESYCIKK